MNLPTNLAHFLWFCGYVAFVANTTLHFVGFANAYRYAAYGLILSYGVIVLRSIQDAVKGRNWTAVFGKLMQDENFQYLLLVTSMALFRPIGILLIPFLAFSIFHIATYAYQMLFRNGKQVRWPAAKKAYDTLMTKQAFVTDAASRLEVYNAFFLFWYLFSGKVGFMQMLIYLQFIRMQYTLANRTQVACKQVRLKLDWLFLSPKCPGMIRVVYVKTRDVVIALCMATTQGGIYSRGTTTNSPPPNR